MSAYGAEEGVTIILLYYFVAVVSIIFLMSQLYLVFRDKYLTHYNGSNLSVVAYVVMVIIQAITAKYYEQ